MLLNKHSIFFFPHAQYFSIKNQERYDVGDAAYNWFMDTAGKKWKEWKSTLKKLYFSGKLTDEELKKKHADRVNSAEWKFLIDYWMTPQCQVRTN